MGAYCVAKLFTTIFKAYKPDVLLTMLRLVQTSVEMCQFTLANTVTS